MAPNGNSVAPRRATRLVYRREVADRTWSFHFQKPSRFTFRAGQFLEVTLLQPKETDAEGNTRAFSISSAPFEDALVVTTRIRDTAFKRNLSNMISGTEVTISDAMGELVLHEDDTRPAVILAGGIGITPFRSIVVEATHLRLAHHVTLLYSNRRPEDAVFLDELDQLRLLNPNFRLVATMTQMEKSVLPWGGETGPIDAAMLWKHVTDLKVPIFYLAGPPKMVKGMHEMLKGVGVPDASIRLEEFDGY